MTGNSLLHKDRKKEVMIFGIFIAVCFSVLMVYAGGVVDIVLTIINAIISFILEVIMAILLFIAEGFLEVTSISITDLKSYGDSGGLFAAFESMAPMIRIIAISLASLFFMSQLVGTLFGPLLGTKQQQSVGGMVIRGFLFIPLTYIMQDLMLNLLNMMQEIYSELLNAAEDVGLGILGFDAAAFWDVSTNSPTVSGAEDGFLASLGDAVQNVVLLIVCAFLQIVIIWEFIKFLFEMTQRFVALIVYAYLSPLAAACAVTPTGGNVLKQTVTVFMSSSVLWMLNIWCVGVMKIIICSVFSYINDTRLYFLWAVISYGFIKIAQQLDDLFNAVGASNVRFSGSILDDVLSMGSMAIGAAKLGKGAIDGLSGLKEKLGNYVNGKSPDRPTAPTDGAKINTGTTAPKPAGNASASGKVDMTHGAKAAAASGGNAAQVTAARAYSAVAKMGDKAKNSLPALAARAVGKYAKEQFGKAKDGAAEMAAAKDMGNLNNVQRALDGGNVSQIPKEKLNTPLNLSNATKALQQAGVLGENEQVRKLEASADGKSLNAFTSKDGKPNGHLSGITSITPDAQANNAKNLADAVAAGSTAALGTAALNDPGALKMATAAMRTDGVIGKDDTVTGLTANADGKTLNAQVTDSNGAVRTVSNVSNIDPNMQTREAANIREALSTGNGGQINNDILNSQSMLTLATETLQNQDRTGKQGTILNDHEQVVSMGVSGDGKSLNIVAQDESGNMRTISGINRVDADNQREKMHEVHSLDSVRKGAYIEYPNCGAASVSHTGGNEFMISGGAMENGRSVTVKAEAGADALTVAAAVAGKIPAEGVLAKEENLSDIRKAVTGDANTIGSAQTTSISHNSPNTSATISNGSGSVNMWRSECGKAERDENGYLTGYTEDTWKFSSGGKTIERKYAHNTGLNDVVNGFVDTKDDTELSQMRTNAGLTNEADCRIEYHRGRFDSSDISNAQARVTGSFTNTMFLNDNGGADLHAKIGGKKYDFEIRPAKNGDGGWDVDIKGENHKTICDTVNFSSGTALEEISAGIIGGNGAGNESLLTALQGIGHKENFSQSNNKNIGSLLLKAKPGGTADNAVGQ